MRKKEVSITLTQESWNLVRSRAIKDGRSVSNQIERLIAAELLRLQLETAATSDRR